MATINHPAFEIALVDMLLARNGSKTGIVLADGESMKVSKIERAELHAAIEWEQYAQLGGVGLSADSGRYFFYSTEIATIEDSVSGVNIFSRDGG